MDICIGTLSIVFSHYWTQTYDLDQYFLHNVGITPMSSHKPLLKNCIEQSKALLSCAQNGEWEGLETKLQARDKMIETLLATNYSAEQAEDVRQAIARIKSSDKRLMALVQDNKDNAFKALKKSGTGKKMKAAYGKTQRPY
ncbi:MAG: flagellar protein FliT [Motiliproteus sp.]